MFKIPIDKIMPVTEARANISALVDDIEKGSIYVLTRGGKPVVVMIPAKHLDRYNKLNNNKKIQSDESVSSLLDLSLMNGAATAAKNSSDNN